MIERPLQVSEKVREIVSALFKIPPDKVTTLTSHDNSEAWDSVGHLNLVLALQEEFSITIDPEEFENLNSVGAIVDFVTNSTNDQKS